MDSKCPRGTCPRKSMYDKALSFATIVFVCSFFAFASTGSANAASEDWNSVVSSHPPVQSVPATPVTGGTSWNPAIGSGDETQEEALSDFWAHLRRSSTEPTLKIGVSSPEKPVAYILAGDLGSMKAWLVDLWYSRWAALTGGQSPPENATAVEWIGGIVSQSRESLEKAGYDRGAIQTNLRAMHTDLKSALENPRAGAIVWIGHGQVGKIIDASADNRTGIISESPVRRWALEFLERNGTYKLPSTYPAGSRMYKAMSVIQNRAHFGIDYFYSHSCLTMQDPSLALAMVGGGGRYEGYLESKLAYVAVLTPAVSESVNQEIPDVHALVVVPDVTGLSREQAKGDLERLGFSVRVEEDGEDEYEAGMVHSQMPYEGTILDRNKSDKTVGIYVYKEPGAGQGTSSAGEDESKYMVWINKFGNAGRIHAGTAGQYKRPVKYANEWLAGTSQEFLEKEDISGGARHDNLDDAKKAACDMVSNRRAINILGWGAVHVGDRGGKTYYINSLDCDAAR